MEKHATCPKNMIRKIAFIYHQHFKFMIALNLFISLYLLAAFWYNGYNHYPLYMLALFFKTIGYIIVVAVEKIFYQPRAYHFRNLGLSYRMLFGCLYVADLLLFFLLLFITGVCKTYI